MKRCPTCNNSCRDSALFCDSCGAPLEDEVEETIALDGRNPDRHAKGGIDAPAKNGEGALEEDIGDAENITMAFLPEHDEIHNYIHSNSPSPKGQTIAFGNIDPSPGPQREDPPFASHSHNTSSQQVYIAASNGSLSGKRTARRGFQTILIALLCCTAIFVAGIGITYSVGLWGGIPVPDVLGLSAEEACEILEQSGFTVTREFAKSDDEPNIVLTQSPEPRTRLSSGSNIVITISTERKIPNLIGMNIDKATELLSSEGFNNVTIDKEESDEAPNSVISVSPEAGSVAGADAEVYIVISIPYTIPDVASMTQQAAVYALEAAGYPSSIKYEYNEDVEEGYVIGTEPAAGQDLAKGSNVTILVSKHRGSELTALTNHFFEGNKRLTIDGVNYEISRIENVKYEGGNTCSYTIVARAYEELTLFGKQQDARFGPEQKITGRISWSDDNQISSTDPRIEGA